ncbi:death-associated protein-like 1 homolog isoform X1 [Pempheris klunzingeri]|uniref:death-associated protein-like 1 homolog isoform X1 n=1 Tax=Pempheris klunzingeri TaxID=3127111 RepID=UPI00397FFC3A
MVQQLSKSGAKETPLLKAGHPPAVKAGGKRVAKKGLEEGATHGTPEKETKRSDKLSRSLATASRMQQVGILLAGTLDKLGHNFPETPVSVRHSKVRPAVEKPHSPRTFFIQQPRKY